MLFTLLLTGMVLKSFSSETINISSTPADSTNPKIAIDPKGRILILWSEMDWPLQGIADVLYVTLENGHWSEIKETVSQLYDARSPDLMADASGKFHLTYDDGQSETTRDIFYRNFSIEEDEWSNIQRVCLNDSNSSNPRIAVDQNGKIYVMWSQQYGQAAHTKIVMNTQEDEMTWPEAFEDVSRNENSSAIHPSFEVKNRDVYACWMDDQDGTWDLFLSEKILDEWSPPIRLNNAGEKCWPSLVLDKENNIHILYSTNEGDIFYMKRVNNMWSFPLIISSGLCPSCIPTLKLFKNNTLHAVWIQEIDSSTYIFYARGTSEGHWRKPIQIPVQEGADKPEIEIDDEGNTHIVWEDVGNDNNKDIFYTEIIQPGSNPTADISSSKDAAIVPFTVTFDASNSNAGEGVIISYWWDFGDGSEMEKGAQVSHTYSKTGIFPVKLYVTNSQLLVGFQTKDIHILPGPFPPIDILVKETQEGGLFYREKINALTWKENPENKGQVLISHYNIYRKQKNQDQAEFNKIGQVNNSIFKYADRDFLSSEERETYTYAISSVDDKGREGPFGFALSLKQEEEKRLKIYAKISKLSQEK